VPKWKGRLLALLPFLFMSYGEADDDVLCVYVCRVLCGQKIDE
jgi:hypothetical protein